MAQRLSTTRRGQLKPLSADEIAARTAALPCAADTDSLTLSHYDKPMRSLRETFFVTNHYGDTLRGLTLRLHYTDTDGEMLHQRQATVTCNIPPHETRQLYLTAWDRQYTYYYTGTRIRPSSSRAIAYDAVLTPLSVLK